MQKLLIKNFKLLAFSLNYFLNAVMFKCSDANVFLLQMCHIILCDSREKKLWSIGISKKNIYHFEK